MKPSNLMQSGYNHAMEGFPYLWNLDRDDLTRDELREYARGYLWSRPNGLAAEQKAYSGNLKPAQDDAEIPGSFFAFLAVIAKCFIGGSRV